MNTCKVIVVVFLLTSVTEGQIPQSLQRSLDMRRSMRTAYLRYRLSTSSVRNQNLTVKNLETRTSGGSYFVANYGDDDGVMWLNVDGAPHLGISFACAPRLDLIDQEKGEIWTYISNSSSAGLRTTTPRVNDVRCIGLACYPLIQSLGELEEEWRELFVDGSYCRTRESGDLIEITLERELDTKDHSKHRRVFSWTIDKSKDYALIKIDINMLLRDQKSMAWGHCETQYKFIDGYWFPAKCSGWQLARENQIVSAEYELQEAQFDRPQHPRKLNVDMLNIPAGAWIGRPETGEQLVWDGSTPIPREKWLEIREATGNHESEDLMEKNQKADNYKYPIWWYDDSATMGIRDLETNPDSWEAYVRRWCLKNSADEKQRTAAKAILEDSRKEARTILAKRAPELDKIEKQLKDAKLSATKAAEARAEGQRLLAPIAEIFNRLKSRLEPLLLQKQISAKQPTSAPARTP